MLQEVSGPLQRAASTAVQDRIDIKGIKEAAIWQRLSTLQRHYFKPLGLQSLSSLGTCIAICQQINILFLYTLGYFLAGVRTCFFFRDFTIFEISSFSLVSASLGPMASLMLPTQPPLRDQNSDRLRRSSPQSTCLFLNFRAYLLRQSLVMLSCA